MNIRIIWVNIVYNYILFNKSNEQKNYERFIKESFLNLTQQRLLHFRSKIYRNILCAINIEISTVLMFRNFLRV